MFWTRCSVGEGNRTSTPSKRKPNNKEVHYPADKESGEHFTKLSLSTKVPATPKHSPNNRVRRQATEMQKQHQDATLVGLGRELESSKGFRLVSASWANLCPSIIARAPTFAKSSDMPTQ